MAMKSILKNQNLVLKRRAIWKDSIKVVIVWNSKPQKENCIWWWWHRPWCFVPWVEFGKESVIYSNATRIILFFEQLDRDRTVLEGFIWGFCFQNECY
jgi:hypothetical protein